MAWFMMTLHIELSDPRRPGAKDQEGFEQEAHTETISYVQLSAEPTVVNYDLKLFTDFSR